MLTNQRLCEGNRGIAESPAHTGDAQVYLGLTRSLRMYFATGFSAHRLASPVGCELLMACRVADACDHAERKTKRKSAAAIPPRVFRQRVRVASNQRRRFEPRSGCRREMTARRTGIVRVRAEVDFPACGAASAARHAISDSRNEGRLPPSRYALRRQGRRPLLNSIGPPEGGPYLLISEVEVDADLRDACVEDFRGPLVERRRQGLVDVDDGV